MPVSLLKHFGDPTEAKPKTRLQAFMDVVDFRSREIRRHPVFVLHYDEQAQNAFLSHDIRLEACKAYMHKTKDSSLTSAQISDIQMVMNEHPDGMMYEVMEELGIEYLQDWIDAKRLKQVGNVTFLGQTPSP